MLVRSCLVIAAVVAAFALGACEGPEGPRGPAGDQGPPGSDGEPGQTGDAGVDEQPWNAGDDLVVEVLEADISGATATATVRITDAAGVPLDREGALTEGAVDMAFALAWLDEEDGEPRQYTSYITREVESPITENTATQATTETGGSWEVVDRADGVYRYTFAAEVEPHAGLTHTVGVSASRAVAGTTHRDDAVFHFVPGGGTPDTTRQVVTDEQCSSCHGELEAHGGRYTETQFCTMCHTDQTTDPDTGNTVDFPVMVHRIHAGAGLPSVQAGTPYQIIGHGGSVHDFSTVHYPQPIARCESCHAGTQGDFWNTRVTVAACTSCHDDIVFSTPVPEGKTLHGGGTQPLDQPCSDVCHPATGSIAGIIDVHTLPAFDPASPELDVDILGVTNAAPGQQPIVELAVTVDGAPRDILASPLTRLGLTFAGPNTDFASYWQATAQGGGAAGTLTAVDAAQGRFSYQVPASAALPPDATGSFTVGVEAYIQEPGGPRFSAHSPTEAFAVTDPEPVARRTVVTADKCNACHYDLAFHGGGRKNANYCILCHNPENANDDYAPRLEGAEVFVETVDFKVMIHKIHAGAQLSQPYQLGGYPGTSPANPVGAQHTYDELHYPRPLSECGACHVEGTTALPLTGALPSLHAVRRCGEAPGDDADEFCNDVEDEALRVPPETAACTSCHDAPYSLAHAEVMTAPSGAESCATCHGPGSGLDVATVHGL